MSGNMAKYVQFIKNGDVMMCDNYRAVTLLWITYKILAIFYV